MIKQRLLGGWRARGLGWTAGVSLAMGVLALPAWAANEIVVGQSVPLTGVAASVGIPLAAGTQAVIDAVNAAGGIRGTKIKLITLDDNFVPARSHDNVKKLVGEEKAVAVLNVIGAPNSEGLVKQNILSGANVPLIGPFTASSGVRALKSPHIFFVAAGAQHEADTMVKQARSMGLTRFGVMYQNDLFGQDGLAEVQRAAKEVGAEVAATGPFERNAEDIQPAVDALGKAGVPAIFMFAPGVTSAKFAAMYRKQYGKGTLLISSSAGSTSAIVAAAPTPADASGIGLVQVLPNPASTKERISIDYREHMAKHGAKDGKISSYSLQGYVSGRLLVDALKSIQGPVTGASVIAALESMKKHAVSNLTYDFSGGNRQGIVYTDIGIIGSAGKLLN